MREGFPSSSRTTIVARSSGPIPTRTDPFGRVVLTEPQISAIAATSIRRPGDCGPHGQSSIAEEDGSMTTNVPLMISAIRLPENSV